MLTHEGFPKAGVGSWAQWRKRVKKAGGLSIAVDGALSNSDPWAREHMSRLGSSYFRVNTEVADIERGIADRKAG